MADTSTTPNPIMTALSYLTDMVPMPTTKTQLGVVVGVSLLTGTYFGDRIKGAVDSYIPKTTVVNNSGKIRELQAQIDSLNAKLGSKLDNPLK